MKPRKLVLAPKAVGPTQKQIGGRLGNGEPAVSRTSFEWSGGAVSRRTRQPLPG
jgi:hypothetical protein